MTRYWIIVASHNHVQKGREEGFAQANHGKNTSLKRMKMGDGLVFYSPKKVYGKPEPYQAFTAIGRVQDEEIYQVSMSPDFHPFRRNIEFFDSDDLKIHPLIKQLGFIEDKQHWGSPFRYGFLEIPAEDYALIYKQMIIHQIA